MLRVACVGDNCIDYYDAAGEAFPGGNPVNVAVYFRRLGLASSYTGVVGSDAYGELLRRALTKKGVDVCRLRTLPGATAVSHVRIVNGDRVFGRYDEGVMADFNVTEEDLDFLCTHDLVVTGLWSHMEGALAAIRARGVPVAFDAADRPFDPVALTALPSVTVAFFSDDHSGDEALRETLRRIAALGPRIAVATRGSRGSLAFDGSEFYDCAPAPCRVVDTMGAGDSFIAGFLTAWLRGSAIPACMAAGAENAAVTIGYRGAW